jgi:hypothetical protein
MSSRGKAWNWLMSRRLVKGPAKRGIRLMCRRAMADIQRVIIPRAVGVIELVPGHEYTLERVRVRDALRQGKATRRAPDE